jgi:hypothetical protein
VGAFFTSLEWWVDPQPARFWLKRRLLASVKEPHCEVDDVTFCDDVGKFGLVHQVPRRASFPRARPNYRRKHHRRNPGSVDKPPPVAGSPLTPASPNPPPKPANI